MDSIVVTESKSGRRRGPVARPGRIRVTVYLDQTLAEWGKEQEGGLSDLMRRLLTEAKAREGNPGDVYPVELRSEYQRLIDRKLRIGLTPDEEITLAAVRARINVADRNSAAWRESERAAEVIDRELADLRRIIENLPERTDADTAGR